MPLVILIQYVIPVIQQIIATVCNWVSSVVQVVIQVMTQVCGWLPWPFNRLCQWVVRLVTTLQTVWDYICNTVIQTIITLITYVLSLVSYIIRWICITINLTVNWVAYLFCLIGMFPQQKIRICIKVLTDKDGNTKVNKDASDKSIETMTKIYNQCYIDVEVDGIEYIVKPEYLASTGCGFGGLFSMWHLWFTQNACSCCNQITVFFVDDITDPDPTVNIEGCAFPGDSWCRVDAGINNNPTIMAHEVGHLLLLGHSDDPNNFMAGQGVGYEVTTNQCCTMKRSPFVMF